MTKNHSATLKKGLRVLELIKKKPGTTMRDVQEAFNLSKSTAFRLLTTLEDMGYIYKIQTQYYLDPNNFMEKSEKQSIREWTSLNSIYQIAKSLQMSTYLGKVEGTDLVMSQVLHAPFTEKAEEEIIDHLTENDRMKAVIPAPLWKHIMEVEGWFPVRRTADSIK